MRTYRPLSPATAKFLSGLGLYLDPNHPEKNGVVMLSQGPMDMGDEGGFSLLVRRDLLEDSNGRLGTIIAREIFFAGVKAGEIQVQKCIKDALGLG